jgi:hypothetical protein
MSLLPCPCGSRRPVMLWRKAPKAHLYVMRCPTCRRQSRVATVDFEKLDEEWNNTVRTDRENTHGRHQIGR